MLIIYLDEETTVTPEMWKFLKELTGKQVNSSLRSVGSDLIPIDPPRRGRPPKIKD